MFSVVMKDVSIFKAPNGIPVNICGMIKKKKKMTVIPLHLTTQVRETHANLLRDEEACVNEDSSNGKENNEQDSRP